MENIVISERRPSPRLEKYIQTYWQGSFNVNRLNYFSQSVLPNGCIELIFHISDDHCHLERENRSPDRSPNVTLIGLYETPYEVTFLQPVRVFGVRFYPDGFRNIAGIAPGEFGRSYETGQDVFGDGLESLYQQLYVKTDFDEQAEAADSFFTALTEKNDKAFDYTHLAMELMRSRKGLGQYEEVVREIPISIRQLQREFRNLYGISPRDYMRMLRMNAVQNYMLQNQTSLTRLSFDMNFSDQSHFIREFRTFSGTTPGRFKKRNGEYILNPGFPRTRDQLTN